MSNFDTIKNDIIGRLKNNSFEKCFLVRNTRSALLNEIYF